NFSKIKVFIICNSQHFRTIFAIDEFAFFVQEFQRVPLFWIMGSSKNNSTVCIQFRYHHFYCWRCRKSEINNIYSQTLKRSCHQRVHHFTRNSRIASNDQSKIFSVMIPLKPRSESCSKFYHIYGSQVIIYFSANGSADA